MKIDRFETHDRLLMFNHQNKLISEGCQDCIKNRPEEYGDHPFYIFAHKRSLQWDERINLFQTDHIMSQINPNHLRKYFKSEDVPSHRLIWEPRLTKPVSQTNSMLFKSYPPGDNIKIIWIIPEREIWPELSSEHMLGSDIVSDSIYLFQYDRKELEKKEIDDLPDHLIQRIMREIGLNAQKRKNINTMVDKAKQALSVASSTS